MNSHKSQRYTDDDDYQDENRIMHRLITKLKRESTESPKQKRSSQNPCKNIPGLIFQRVARSIKAYLSNTEDKKLAYIGDILDKMSTNDKERLLHFLKLYDESKKTWKNIEEHLKDPNLDLGEIILNVIICFLGGNGEEDFEDWVENGKLKQSKDIVIQKKESYFKRKFEILLQKLKERPQQKQVQEQIEVQVEEEQEQVQIEVHVEVEEQEEERKKEKVKNYEDKLEDLFKELTRQALDNGGHSGVDLNFIEKIRDLEEIGEEEEQGGFSGLGVNIWIRKGRLFNERVIPFLLS